VLCVLQQATRLTFLELAFVTAAALQHLSSLTKLQHLSISALRVAEGWAAADCPGLHELKALTSLKLSSLRARFDLPASVSQLTALQQLEVQTATPTALNRLQALTGLTQLCVGEVAGLSPESPPLKLPGLQHLELGGEGYVRAPMPESFLSSCTQVHVLNLQAFTLKGPSSLAASTALQHLKLHDCRVTAVDGATDPASWQQVFSGPGRLPHLTSLHLTGEEPAMQRADINQTVACCSNLAAFALTRLSSRFAPALARLTGLTDLQLHYSNDKQCRALVQLTGLKQLKVASPHRVSAVGLRQLAALQQLTSLWLGYFSCSQLDSQLDTVAQHLVEDTVPLYSVYAIIIQVCVDPAFPGMIALVFGFEQ